jgi:anion-transporting  ArsA/GET3 family ATPase
MAYKEDKEEKTLERAQRDAEMVSEYAKDARNRREAEKISNKLEDEIESKEYTVENVLDETRNNIRNTTKEAQREIPQNTRIIDDMLQTTIKTAREITDSYIESQKDIIKVYQSIWAPYIENVSRFWRYWLVSPKNSLDIWKRSS